MARRIHNVCPDCGAILDTGERCDCGGTGDRVQTTVTVRPTTAAVRPVKQTRKRKKAWKPAPGTEAYRIYQRGL